MTRISHFDRNRSRIGYIRGGGSVSWGAWENKVNAAQTRRHGSDR